MLENFVTENNRASSRELHRALYDIRRSSTEAVTRGVLCKKVLLEISQNSQENTSARVSFLIKLQTSASNFIKKETLAEVLSCEFCEIFKNTFFTEHLWTTASTLALRARDCIFTRCMQRAKLILGSKYQLQITIFSNFKEIVHLICTFLNYKYSLDKYTEISIVKKVCQK